ncbi:hypothetical protein [Nocardia terpenica]|uniref:Uncharacterized protein n=1 Tax=Nocardia terpenica TaxID=455432 RepID=A0A6G9ZAP8_9NOCA|nr:hypothetical protein [Nocardia terpenica]QIS22675.1 hypothetical protein F6W96_34365 [Nocardia terpenica]
MVTIRNYRRSAFVMTVFAALGMAAASTAAPALADDNNTIKVTGVGPENVGVDYRCASDAGVVAIKAMAGAPEADRPSATGAQSPVTCDGSPQTDVVVLNGAKLTQGQQVQVRVALVTSDDTVVSGYANVYTLG